MPPAGKQPTANHRIVRMMRCVRGRIAFEVDIAPRFDYGRKEHETQVIEHGAVFVTEDLSLTLHVVREPGDERLAQVRLDGGDIHIDYEMSAGQTRGLVLESAADGPPREIRVAEFTAMFDDATAFWRDWLSQSTYTGRWREMLQRSAITLKLMTYAPTGGTGRRADGRAARADRRRAQLGLPLHLGAGRVVLRLRAARPRASPRRRRTSAAGCATACRRRPAGKAAR